MAGRSVPQYDDCSFRAASSIRPRRSTDYYAHPLGCSRRHLCLRRVIRVVLTARQSLPVYLDKRTFSAPVGMSQTCQQETLALQKRSLRLKALLIRAAPLSVLRLVFPRLQSKLTISTHLAPFPAGDLPIIANAPLASSVTVPEL